LTSWHGPLSLAVRSANKSQLSPKRNSDTTLSRTGIAKPPFAYVLIAMEPSLPVRLEEKYPQLGTFNGALQFAIRKFLVANDASPSYLITNMAKCSIAVSVAQKTRNDRWEACAWSVKEELKLAGAGSGRTCIIAIGREAQNFLQRHDPYPAVVGGEVHYITHYSDWCNPIFGEFASEHAAEFREFCALYEETYRQFRSEPEFYERFDQVPAGDLQRLFKWSHEMGKTKRVSALKS
jgi:hypothetical protein